MESRDGHLNLVRPRTSAAERPLHQFLPFSDLVRIPAGAILILQQYHLAARPNPCIPPRVLEEHESEKAKHLRLVGHERAERPPQPDGLRAQLPSDQCVAGARGVPLVEDQVQDGEHRRQALRKQVVGGNAVRDACLADLFLGPNEALGQGRLRNEEGSSDLGGGEASQRSERERDLCLGGERWVTTGEHEPKAIVRDSTRLIHHVHRLEIGKPLQDLSLLYQSPIPSEAIDGLVPGSERDPCSGVFGDSVRRPSLQSDEEGFLNGLLRKVKVAEDADEGRDRPPRFLPEQTVDDASCFAYSG